MLHDRLDDVRHRIQQAAQRSGRDSSSVTLVCVTKEIAVDMIQQVLSLGVTDLGENRVQEAKEKIHVLASRPLRWHLIGHLQRNKAKDAVAVFEIIHSVDSIALVEVLERQAVKQARRIEVLIQVNVSGETTKFGCHPDDALSLAQAVSAQSHLVLGGMMTIAPLASEAEGARPYFHRLRALRDTVAVGLGRPSETLKLSMGMSHDFEVAIEEGSDIIRIGTAIFGTRDARHETR